MEQDLQAIENRIFSENNPKERNRLYKARKKLEKKIELEKVAVIPKKQRSFSDKFYIISKKFRAWLVILISFILVIIVAASICLSHTYSEFFYYRGLYGSENATRYKLEDNVTSLNKQIKYYQDKVSDLEDEIATNKSDISDLEDEISELQPKADFMDNYIKVVEDDEAKTYHTYGCEYFDDSYFWAYNKEQVIDKPNYTKCPYCN